MKKESILLKKSDRSKRLKNVPLWTLCAKETAMTRSFTFKDHVDGLIFIARITVHAQVQNHHPDILFTYGKVKVTLSTHDVKGLTQKDFVLAEKIDALQSRG